MTMMVERLILQMGCLDVTFLHTAYVLCTRVRNQVLSFHPRPPHSVEFTCAMEQGLWVFGAKCFYVHLSPPLHPPLY